MSKIWKRGICLLLTLVLAAGLLPASTLAAGASEAEERRAGTMASGALPDDMEGGTALTDAYLSGKGSGLANPKKGTPPSYYDARNYGYITPVRDQNPYGTCWAHAAIASIESNMIKHGIRDGYTGYTAGSDVDLSELHLAWFAYTNAYDAKGMLSGDRTDAWLDDLPADEDHTFLNRGGNGQYATFTLMRWTGATSENYVNYSSADSVRYSGLDAGLAYQYDTVRVSDADWIPAANRNAVKNAIMEYGAGTISYYHDDAYMDYSSGAFCYIAPSGQKNTNHVVTLVGWDDSYSRYNFSEASRPSSDGAWLCKNSWGTWFGQDGYFYLSYEDTASRNTLCYFFKAAPSDNYQHNYQYDGTAGTSCLLFQQDCQAANVFTAAAPELIKAVAICTKDENLSYTLKVYRNPKAGNPSSGKLMCTQTGVIPYWGYHTIPLDTPVPVATGDTFSVVFSLSSSAVDENGYRIHLPYDVSSSGNIFSYTHADRGDTSYYSTGSSWYDTPNSGDFRIKAFTDDAHWSVSGTYTPSDLGTVAFDGDSYHLLFTPAITCAYVKSAELTSGKGRCSVDGSRITVDPYSDCEIKVTLAAKHSYSGGYCTVCGAPKPLSAPTVKVTHVSSTGKVKLSWEKVSRAARYEVYRYDADLGQYKLMKTVTDGLSYVNTSGVAGDTYYYAVRAMNDEVDGKFSEVVTGTCRLPRPTVTATHGPNTGKPKLTWKKVSGAVQYKVYRATSKSGTYKLVKTTTSTSFVDSNTTLGKTYYYRVRAVASDTAANSARSPAKALTRRLARPTVKGGHVASTGKNKITWNKVSGAVKYQVYRATSKTDSYKLVKTTTGTSYTNTSAVAGKTYYYRVRAVGSKSSLNSAKTVAKGIVCDLPRPVVTISRKNGKPRLTWKKISGAVKYKVYRAPKKSGPYKLMKTTTSTSYTNTSAVKGKTYYFRVVAVHTKSAANSARSLVKSISATK